MDYSTACPDWRERIVAGRSLVPAPLFPAEADAALSAMKDLRIVDVAGSPTIGECCKPWVLDYAAAVFGAYDHETGRRLIREFFLLVSKKNTKSTLAAAIMLTALIRNWRNSAEYLILAPTLEVANNAFHPARDMIRADPELSDLLHIQEHTRTITHRTTNAVLKVVAADSDTVSGKKATGVLVDELWIFGKKPKADAMLREATGGLVSRPEGFVIYLSTQSDEEPAGVFKSRLQYFRDVRDGKISDRKSLPALYEFPEAMVEDQSYLRPENFYITNPNLGASVDRTWLEDELAKVADAQGGERQVFLAKHLNVEIGLKLANDRWAGADYWEAAGDPLLTLDEVLSRSDVCTVGIDGGGLDDLFGLAVLGRCRTTRTWLLWNKAWAHDDVLKRRKDIAPKLLDFAKQGDLVVSSDPMGPITEAADIVERVKLAGLLPEENGVGLDPAGVAALVDELETRGIGVGLQVAVRQGFALSPASWGSEIKLKNGSLKHGARPMMAWCVGNAKVEVRGGAVVITKQSAGRAKIDPLVASFNAMMLMSRNPAAARPPEYQMIFV